MNINIDTYKRVFLKNYYYIYLFFTVMVYLKLFIKYTLQQFFFRWFCRKLAMKIFFEKYQNPENFLFQTVEYCSTVIKRQKGFFFLLSEKVRKKIVGKRAYFVSVSHLIIYFIYFFLQATN